MGLALFVPLGHLCHMDFKSYRKLRGWTLADVATILNLGDAATVSRHETGRRFPEPELLERYIKLTNGEVTAEDFIEAFKDFQKRNPDVRKKRPRGKGSVKATEAEAA